MLEKTNGYGYKQVGFILDRGYFSKDNIEFMDKCGYDFVIMVKGMATLVDELVLKHKGLFENKRSCCIRKYGVYGMTVKQKLYVTDEKDRYFKIYQRNEKMAAEAENVEEKIEKSRSFSTTGGVRRTSLPTGLKNTLKHSWMRRMESSSLPGKRRM